jgi:hypothetical protein
MIDVSHRPFIVSQRAKGFSWQAISQQIGCSVAGAQAVYETGAIALAAVAPRPDPLPAKPVTPKSRHGVAREYKRAKRKSGVPFRVLQALVEANGKPLQAEAIGGHAGRSTIAKLRGKYGHAIISRSPAGYSITTAGRAVWEAEYAPDGERP